MVSGEERWRPRRVAAVVLRVLIVLVPIAAGFAVGGLVSKAMPPPATVYEIVFWWGAIIAVATVTSTAVDRVARRFLPLTVLLRMTMLFPDVAPSRLRVARRAGNISELRRRVLEAEHGHGEVDLAEMAELVLSLSAALSNHDRRTRGHSERTRAYTDMIAEQMGMAEPDRDRLRWAALLHDVGKLEVPAEILNKDAALTHEEWEIVKQHPVHGMTLVAPLVPWLGTWAKTIEHHHERWDGSGYPHGLAGTDIALGARIVTVADAYDVMTSGRSYQRAMTPAAARKEVASMAGKQFDPVVARALMNVSLGRLRWSTGPLAVLAEIPFLRGLPQVGRDVAMVLTTSAVMTTGFVTGAVPTPEGVDISPREIIEVVIAGSGLGGGPTADPSSGTLAAETPDGVGGGPIDGATTTTVAPGGGDGTTTTPPPPTTSVTTTPGSQTTLLQAAGPTARDDSASTGEDVAVTIAVLANDTDPDGDLDPASLALTGQAASGIGTLGGGNIRYTPDRDFTGTDRLAYRVCDSGGRCDDAVVTVVVTGVNDPPVATPLSATTEEGVPITVSLGYTDPDGDTLTCSMSAPPAVGAATVPSDCSQVHYSPPTSYDGAVTITIRVSDGTVTVSSSVTVTVVAINQAPIAVPDGATSSGGTVTIPVLANDSDPDGDPLTLASVSAPSSGSTARSGSSVVYTPAVGFTGTATFTYQVCDPLALCSTGSVMVSVTGSGAVVANDDSGRVRRNDQVTMSVLANDTGPIDPSTLTVGGASSGTVTVLGGSGRIKYVADSRFTGTVTFTYTVCSASGVCDSAVVRIEVT